MTQDRPEAPELLDALAEYLFTDIRAAVPREERFRVLVAANLCAILAREWRAGEEPLREDLELFGAILGDPPAPAPGRRELEAAVREAEQRLARAPSRRRASTIASTRSPRAFATTSAASSRSPDRATPTERARRGLSAPREPSEKVFSAKPPSIAIASPVM